MTVTMENLDKRIAATKQQIGVLAYEKLGLLDRLNNVEKQIALLEVQGSALEATQADVRTDEAILAARPATPEGETHA